MSTSLQRRRLFVYGTMLSGERDHHLLAAARFLGPARTTADYQLVETSTGAGIVEQGREAVVGELYELDVKALAGCDVHQQHPLLYERRTVRLEGGESAEAYLLRPDQTRGLRRLHAGDWKARFAPAPRPPIGSRGWRR